jgi:hypothetical protein
MRRFLSAVLLCVAVLAAGCDQERKVAGAYRLEQWEDFRTYYLHKRGQDDSSQGGSIIGGTVVRIGWSSRYILAERHSIDRGDPDGWMIIDVHTGTMSGPLTEQDLRTRAEAQGIQIYEAGEAWKRL